MNNLYVLVDHIQKMIISPVQKLPEDWNNIHGLNLLSEEKLYDLDWAEHLGLGWVKLSNNVVTEYSALPECLELSKNWIKKEIANERWNKEIEVVSYKGNQLILDDRTRIALNLQKNKSNDNDVEIKWKFINKFVILSTEEFNEMYDLMTNYIQNCFNEELRLTILYDNIASLTDISSAQFNLNWPDITLI